jgi:hypothetical protein
MSIRLRSRSRDRCYQGGTRLHQRGGREHQRRVGRPMHLLVEGFPNIGTWGMGRRKGTVVPVRLLERGARNSLPVLTG